MRDSWGLVAAREQQVNRYLKYWHAQDDSLTLDAKLPATWERRS